MRDLIAVTPIAGALADPAEASAATAVAGLLRRHLGVDPSGLPSLTMSVPEWDHVNLQASLDAWMGALEDPPEQLGIVVPKAASSSVIFLGGDDPLPLADLLTHPAARLTSPQRREVPDGPGSTRSCFTAALVLASTGDGPVALWVRSVDSFVGSTRCVDVLAASFAHARAVADELRRGCIDHSCFRGQLVRFSADTYGRISVGFDERPAVAPDEIVLPAATRARIEQHALGIAASADRLTAAGRHLKRGLLLHGAPGTGKTHTIRYLLSSLPDATVFVLAGQQMAYLRFVAERAADLGRSVIVMDDVDLVAEDREREGMSPRRHLFDLLDAMDGLRESSDLLFICTTNRPEALEKAIAARPGRVDLAIEVTVPDAACRAQLFRLYGRRLDLAVDDLDGLLARAEGVTASFVKELVRRSAVIAVGDDVDAVDEAGGALGIEIDGDHVAAALDALLDPANPLTATLLGGAPRPDGDPAPTSRPEEPA